jgi:hypothetical protein
MRHFAASAQSNHIAFIYVRVYNYLHNDVPHTFLFAASLARASAADAFESAISA